MKSLVIFLTSAVLVTGCASSTSSSPNPEDSQRTAMQATSADGQTFHFLPIIEDGVTDVTIAMAFPSRWAFTQGLNQAVPSVASELIMNGQTQALKTQEIGELFADKNARGAVFARPDNVIAQLEFPIEHAADIVPVASELLANSSFESRWIDRIKQNFEQRVEEAQQQTTQQMFDVSRAAILQNETLAHSLSLQITDELDGLSQKQITQWHADVFTRQDVVIAVAGPLTQEKAGEIVDSLLSGLPEGKPKAAIDAPANFAQRTVLLHLPEAQKTTLAFIGQLPESSSPGDMADLILLGTLGQQEGSGPLFEALRTELRASYGFQTGYTNYNRDTRLLFITGEVDTDKLAQSVDVVLETYGNYQQGNAMDGWENVQANLVQATTNNLKSVGASAITLLELVLDKQDPQLAVNLGSAIETLTLEDLTNRLADSYPKADELLIVAASADANALPGACVIIDIEQIDQCMP